MSRTTNVLKQGVGHLEGTEAIGRLLEILELEVIALLQGLV
jgi:hypothetical protein